MKNKRIVLAFLILMLGATYSVHAQSSIDQKQKKELERIKKRRQELIMKAQEQQKQSNEERRGPRINSNQQPTQEVPQPGQSHSQQNNNTASAECFSEKRRYKSVIEG